METAIECTLSPMRRARIPGRIFPVSCVAMFLFVVTGFFPVEAQTPENAAAALNAGARKELSDATALLQKGDSASLNTALVKLTSADNTFSKTGDKAGRAETLYARGGAHLALKQTAEAIKDLERSAEFFGEVSDIHGRFLSTALIAALYLKDKDDAKAVPYLVIASGLVKDESYALMDKEALHGSQALFQGLLNLFGEASLRIRNRELALNFLWRAYTRANERSREEAIDALAKYADALVALDTAKLSIPFYEIALQRSETGNLQSAKLAVLSKLADVHLYHLENIVEAKRLLTTAMPLAEAIAPSWLPSILLRLAECAKHAGEIATASELLTRAYETGKRTGLQPSDEGVLLYELAGYHEILGQKQLASEEREKALKFARAGNNKPLEAEIIARQALKELEDGLSATHMTPEQSRETAARIVRQLELSVKLIQEVPTSRNRIRALGWTLEIARLTARGGRLEESRDLFSKALEASRALGYRFGEGQALLGIANIKSASGDHRGSVEDLNQAVAIFRSVGLTALEGRALAGLMTRWEKLGNPSLAIFFGKNAVNTFQGIRRNLSGLPVEQQNQLLTLFEDAYRTLARILIAQGRISEAESVLTMLKQQELVEYVRRDDAVAKQMLETLSMSEEERQAITRYGQLAESITAAGKEFSELDIERKQYPPGEFPQQKRYDELKRQLADATLAFEKFLVELKVKFGQGDVRVAQVDSSLKKTLERLKAHRVAVVSTIVGEDTLNIIVTTSRTQRAHAVKKTAEEINKLVAKLREALTSPQYDPRPASQQLYDLLVKPMEGDLAGIKADTIVWSLDGTLRYIPPAVLWDREKGYLAERYANVIINLASRDTIALPVQKGSQLSVLGVGVSKPVDGFASLTAVPDELDCIVSDKSAGVLSLNSQCRTGVLEGRKLLDEKFTLANFQSELGRYPIVHIASHFKLTPGDDKNSFLLLGGGDDRRYTVDRLRNESLADVELIVLSACNTATPGGAKANGVEIEGFGSIAQSEGAKAVMASLWPVADNSTKDFMVEFYRLYGREGRSKADAVRLAQMKLLKGDYRGGTNQNKRADDFVTTTNTMPAFTTDPKAPYAHPYFWSPFILIGNWR